MHFPLIDVCRDMWISDCNGNFFFLRSTLVQVLVVQEKYSASSLLGAWKLPTGFVHAVRIQAEGTWY
jgi:hypothetical protein